MVIDCHVHTCAVTPGHGSMSERLLKSLPFRFMRWRLGIRGADAQTERDLETRLDSLLDATPEIDAAVILAFDAVHDESGRLDEQNTHLYVTNDYAAELAGRNRKMLFGASVHPYRKDAAAEVERCVKMGAVLLKWLPPTQAFNPADERCLPFYDALAHYGLPLLSHTGGELSLPNLRPETADPTLLEPALRRGVTVIAAHCGTRSSLRDTSYVEQFMRMAREHEHFYGDTSALNIPTRAYAYKSVLADKAVRNKLIHGSDWPILPVPPVTRLGIGTALRLLGETNWIRRDVLIKQRLGLDEAYWHRGGKILRLADRAAAGPVPAISGDQR